MELFKQTSNKLQKNMEANVEIIQFHEDKLACPIINGQPYVIVNNIIKTIGLDERNARRNLTNNQHLNKYVLYVKTESRGQNETREIVENDKKDEIISLKWSQSDHNFLLNGKIYIALPVRKIPAWLYSIDITKVNPVAKKALSLYQDECDEVLYDHFFGSDSRRKTLLSDITRLTMRLEQEEDILSNNTNYQNRCNLKAEIMRISKELKGIDTITISNQRGLWDQDFVNLKEIN